MNADKCASILIFILAVQLCPRHKMQLLSQFKKKSLAEISLEDVEKLNECSMMMGEDAKDAGLNNEICGLEEAKLYLQEEFVIETVLCVFEYRNEFERGLAERS